MEMLENVFEQALNIQLPWKVTSIGFNKMEKVIDIHNKTVNLPHDIDKMGDIIMKYAQPILEDIDRWDAKILQLFCG
ncbi:MAG: hypothetical protein HQL05_11415 [Nitrospirae bacterium]|nr:hypothetical protein [Nitrospirota bacterium]